MSIQSVETPPHETSILHGGAAVDGLTPLDHEIASWAEELETSSQEEVPGVLLFILDEIDRALADPSKRAALEARGIDGARVDALRDQLTGSGRFDAGQWFSLFNDLSHVSSVGSFGPTSSSRLKVADLAVRIVAMDFTQSQQAEGQIQGLEEAGMLLEKDRGGEPRALTDEELDALARGGFGAADTSNAKLRGVLDGSGDRNVTFTAEERESILDEVEEKRESIPEQDMHDLQLQLQTANNLLTEIKKVISSIKKALHDGKQGAVDKIGAS